MSRLKYLTHLRAEHRKSPKTAADAEHVAAKAALLRIQIEEKKRTLVARDEADVLLDQIAGPPWSALQEPTTHESLKNRFGNPDKLAKPNNLPK